MLIASFSPKTPSTPGLSLPFSPIFFFRRTHPEKQTAGVRTNFNEEGPRVNRGKRI